MTDPQSCIDQMAEWLKGNPLHNTERNECCPDFSCCQPTLLWPIETRQEFVDAGEDKRHSMLMMSLGAMIANMGKQDEVYIAGSGGIDA